MTLVTLRPDGTASNPGFTVNGAASAQAALSDNSDASYVYDRFYVADAQAPSTILLNFSTVALPAGAYIKSIAPRIRYTSYDAAGYAIRSSKAGSPLASSGVSGLVNRNGAAAATTTGGATAPIYADVQNEVDSLQLFLTSSASNAVGAGQFQVFEVYLDVNYNAAPVASAVVGSSFTSAAPAIGWTYTDPDGDLQERYQVKLFTLAQTVAGGFDPAVTVPAWDSGVVMSAGTSVNVSTANLVNGTSYKAYVRVNDAGNAGNRWSAWASSGTLLYQLDLPAAPLPMVIAAQASTASLDLTFQAVLNLLATNDASVEGGIGNWVSAANATLAQDATQAAGGSFSLKMTSVAAGNMSARLGTGLYAASNGNPFTGRASFRPAITRNCMVSLLWYNAAGALLSQSDSVATSCPAGAWTALVVNGTAPVNTAWVGLQVTEQATAAAAEVTNVDLMGIMPGTNSPWSRGGLDTSVIDGSNGNTISTATFEVQRSYDNGVTWETAVTSLGTRFNPSTQLVQAGDWLVRPNTAVKYRARITATDGTYTLTSAWSAPSTAATVPVTDFWLKHPSNFGMSMRVSVAGDLVSTSEESQGAFRPLGRSRAVVVSGDVYGEEFQLPLSFRTEADWRAFEALRLARTTLLLQSDMTDQWWVRLGPSRQVSLRNRSERRTKPYREVSVTATEVDGV